MASSKEIKEKIKASIEIYNKFAQAYITHTSNKLLQFQLNEFISMLPKKAKVLDVGCGAGRDAEYLTEEGLDVLGIDIATQMIKEAKKKKIKVKKKNILDLKKGDFDGIWCMATLSDIPKSEINTVLTNFHNLLNENGIVYIAVKEGEGEKFEEKERYENQPRFYAYYKQDELEKNLAENNFKIIKSTKTNDQGVNWIEIFARKSS